VLGIERGYSADYLTNAVAAGRESYYTGAVAAGEPPGRWNGAGAAMLGLTGEVDPNDMVALFKFFIDPRDPAFRQPSKWAEADRLGHGERAYKSADQWYAAMIEKEPDATPERREELRLDAASRARQNVSFWDATFSVNKDITVLHAAFEKQEVDARGAGDRDAAGNWATYRQAVEDAVWAGNQAMLDYLSEHAGYTRVGHHGGAGGRWMDAHGLVVASFFQHDNRDHEPHLHIHNAILNRVQGSDGKWRTPDAALLYDHKEAAGRLADRVTEEHLTRTLGVQFATRPDGQARQMRGIAQETLDLFSNRRRTVTAKTAEYVRAYVAKTGKQPNAKQLYHLQQQATRVTKRAKEHAGESVEQRLERWDRELREQIAGGLTEVATNVLALTDRPTAESFSAHAVLEAALADAEQEQAVWTEARLRAKIAKHLPDHVHLRPGKLRELIEGLAREGIGRGAVAQVTADGPGAASIPGELKLANGMSSYERPGARLYATSRHLVGERVLAASTRQLGAPALAGETASAFLRQLREQYGVELGVDQGAAVRGVLTSGAELEALVAAAGTGKSFVVGVLAKAWQDPDIWGGAQRRAFGLAASQIATEVLTDEGLQARNISRWLATQERLSQNSVPIRLEDRLRLTRQPSNEPDSEWELRDGDLIVIDEAAMVPTRDLQAIREHAAAAGAKILLTGDHRQLSAVGAGGAMGLVAEAGTTYELSDVRRFDAAWEGPASLALREGERAALQEYRKHGRILDAGTAEQAQAAAARAYLADVLAGKQSRIITDTNEQAGQFAALVRRELVRLGQVEEDGVVLGRDGTVAGVGDLVEAHKNRWDLARYDDREAPLNRASYRVLAILQDGRLRVARVNGAGRNETLGRPMTLPGDYVAGHLTLAYASTAHASQGLTVDTCHSLVTSRTTSRSLYVGMSRGRECNTAYVTTLAMPDDAPPGAGADIKRRDAMAVLDDILENHAEELSAIQEAAKSAEDARSVRTASERFYDAAQLAVHGRTTAALDRLVATGTLTAAQRERLAVDAATADLARVLWRAELAGHDPARVLENAVTLKSFPADTRSPAALLIHRIERNVGLEPSGERHQDWMPELPDPTWVSYAQQLAKAADERAAQLGEAVAREQPQWAVEALGMPPEEELARHEWIRRAAAVAAHRELTGHDDEAVALPGPPRPGKVVEYASFRAGWRALGQPEADRAEKEMSNGQLRLRVQAYEREKAWEPPYMAQELAGTAKAEARHRQTVQIRLAEAAASNDDAERTRLEREAHESRALAGVLARRVQQLQEADRVRSLWFAHTAATRAAADRARDELRQRGVDETQLDDQTTAEEWLAAHAEAVQEDDQVREVTGEEDLADVVEARDRDGSVVREFEARTQSAPAPDRSPATTQPTPEAQAAPPAGGMVVRETGVVVAAGERKPKSPAREVKPVNDDTVTICDTSQLRRQYEERKRRRAEEAQKDVAAIRREATVPQRILAQERQAAQERRGAEEQAARHRDSETSSAGTDAPRADDATKPDTHNQTRSSGGSRDDDWDRVPDAEETAAAVARARAALLEMRLRQQLEEQHRVDEQRAIEEARREADERDQQLARDDEQFLSRF
jgi:hypothetical protein